MDNIFSYTIPEIQLVIAFILFYIDGAKLYIITQKSYENI